MLALLNQTVVGRSTYIENVGNFQHFQRIRPGSVVIAPQVQEGWQDSARKGACPLRFARWGSQSMSTDATLLSTFVLQARTLLVQSKNAKLKSQYSHAGNAHTS